MSDALIFVGCPKMADPAQTAPSQPHLISLALYLKLRQYDAERIAQNNPQQQNHNPCLAKIYSASGS